MKKTIRLIDLDCANCAAKIEAATAKLDGVNSASVSIMTQKMVIDAEDDRLDAIIKEVKSIVKKLEPDVTVKA